MEFLWTIYIQLHQSWNLWTRRSVFNFVNHRIFYDCHYASCVFWVACATVFFTCLRLLCIRENCLIVLHLLSCSCFYECFFSLFLLCAGRRFIFKLVTATDKYIFLWQSFFGQKTDGKIWKTTLTRTTFSTCNLRRTDIVLMLVSLCYWFTSKLFVVCCNVGWYV